MWKVTFPDAQGEPLGFSYWATFEEAQENQRWLVSEYGIEASIFVNCPRHGWELAGDGGTCSECLEEWYCDKIEEASDD